MSATAPAPRVSVVECDEADNASRGIVRQPISMASSRNSTKMPSPRTSIAGSQSMAHPTYQRLDEWSPRSVWGSGEKSRPEPAFPGVSNKADALNVIPNQPYRRHRSLDEEIVQRGACPVERTSYSCRRNSSSVVATTAAAEPASRAIDRVGQGSPDRRQNPGEHCQTDAGGLPSTRSWRGHPKLRGYQVRA